MLKLKRSAMKYKDANGTMQDVGAVVGTQTPDAVLSETSTNSIQNKVVAAKISELETANAGKADKITGTPEQVVGFDANGNMIATDLDIKSGSSLPEVSESDNGKILQVVNGAWTPTPVAMGAETLF
jgi:hypothetical protein